MDNWNQGLQTEIQRLYDLTQAIQATGSSVVSPVTVVGPGADQVLTSVSRFTFADKAVAGAGFSGGLGISIPQGDARVVVVRKVTLTGFATNEYQALLASFGGYVPNFTLLPSNKRNNPENNGPNFGFVTLNTTPAVGDLLADQQFQTTSTRWATLEDVVLVQNTALVIKPIALAQTFLVDFVVDVYSPQSK